MSYTKDDLEQIKNAILSLATGKRRVKVPMSNGSSIEYGQADLKALRELQQEISTTLTQTNKISSFRWLWESLSFGLFCNKYLMRVFFKILFKIFFEDIF